MPSWRGVNFLGNRAKEWRMPEPPPIGRVVLWLAVLFALIHGCMALYEQTVQYFALSDGVGFLPLKKKVIHLPHWKSAFYVHVFTSIFALFAAFTQFVPIKNRWLAKVHRWAGRIYVFNILLLCAPSGLLLACYAEGGIVGRLGFATLACLWFATTALGLRAILKRKVSRHQEWMIRSYALTFSAVTLREWQYWFAVLLPPTYNTFPLVAWLGWLLNLMLAEIWIRWKRRSLLALELLPKTVRDH